MYADLVEQRAPSSVSVERKEAKPDPSAGRTSHELSFGRALPSKLRAAEPTVCDICSLRGEKETDSKQAALGEQHLVGAGVDRLVGENVIGATVKAAALGADEEPGADVVGAVDESMGEPVGDTVGSSEAAGLAGAGSLAGAAVGTAGALEPDGEEGLTGLCDTVGLAAAVGLVEVDGLVEAKGVGLEEVAGLSGLNGADGLSVLVGADGLSGLEGAEGLSGLEGADEL